MIYALIQSGIVVNTIVWDGESEVEFPDGVTPALVAEGVNCSTGYTAAEDAQGDWTYAAPVLPPPPPPTADEILASNTVTRNQLLAAATLAIAPLQDADDLGEATADETALLKSWKQFRVAVNRVDLTLQNAPWPVAPQTGYGAAQTPPVQTS